MYIVYIELLVVEYSTDEREFEIKRQRGNERKPNKWNKMLTFRKIFSVKRRALFCLNLFTLLMSNGVRAPIIITQREGV